MVERVRFESLDSEVWGYRTSAADPAAFAARIADEVTSKLGQYEVLPEGPEPCRDKPGFFRVSVGIPLGTELFDQFLNGNGGYRAQYFVGIPNGERFNRTLVDCIAPFIVAAEDLYRDKFDRKFCEQSLCGEFSKFWYSKDITDPSAREYLLHLPEVIKVERWLNYWSQGAKPWKGLLAPRPESSQILLNGTFVDRTTGAAYEQKPERSRQLYQSGWT